MTITVNAVNDAPVNNVPRPADDQRRHRPWSSPGASLISISDVDAAASPLQVTLTVTNGTLTLSSIDAACRSPRATARRRHDDLHGHAQRHQRGPGRPVLPADAGTSTAAPRCDHHQRPGQHGHRRRRSDTDTVTITVTAVNDAPINTVPGAQTTTRKPPASSRPATATRSRSATWMPATTAAGHADRGQRHA